MSFLLSTLIALGALTAGGVPTPAAKEPRLFELRVYYAAPDKLEALNARFRDHTTKLFEKHGITNIGYWVPADNKQSQLIYFLAFPNKAEQEKSWKAFADDPEWKAAYQASEVNGKLVAKVESHFYVATDYSPRVKPATRKNERLFELRTYTSTAGNMDDLNARFRNHTIKIFKRYGVDVLGFWVPSDKAKDGENTLVYLIAHKSEAKRLELAEKFPKDPEWLKVKEESERNGKLVEKVESILLKPVDYSPMK